MYFLDGDLPTRPVVVVEEVLIHDVHDGDVSQLEAHVEFGADGLHVDCLHHPQLLGCVLQLLHEETVGGGILALRQRATPLIRQLDGGLTARID